MSEPPRVVWLFSMTRSGSSAAVYASAHALGWAVADEPFGPWDRTAPPYGYPPEQPELHRRHLAASEILNPQTNELFDRVVAAIADREDAPGVVVKMPHDMVSPADVASLRPADRSAYLIRNPLARLSSLHTRGWQSTIQRPHDFERFKAFAARWTAAPRPRRLTFEQLTTTPRRFFRALWRAWGIAFDEQHVESAVAYRASHYHESSAVQVPGRNTHRVLSAHRRAVPPEACAMYLHDPTVAALFDRLNWDTDPSAYCNAFRRPPTRCPSPR